MQQYTKYWWLNEESHTILKRGYLQNDETVEQAIDRIANTAAEILKMPDIAAKIKEAVEMGWISLSSPIWANLGTNRLPISCFGSVVDDSIKSIAYKTSECIEMTRMGGGTSGYFGNLRPRGSKVSVGGESNGAVSFMRLFDTVVDVISQGKTRRGAFAAYLPIEHKDIEEFLNIKSIGSPIQNLFTGVTIKNDWMQSMIDGDVDKRKTWAKVLQSRKEKGIPYIFFHDNANNNKPQVFKDKDKTIYASNLCSEIMLPSTHDESFVCCLSSLNLETYEIWKDTDVVRTITFLLDAVMEDFIHKTDNMNLMVAANRFAKSTRSLGIGYLGLHSFYQQNNIAFESMEAKVMTSHILKNVKQKAEDASKELATIFGEPELMKGYGMRNATLFAIAPTTSSSAILGQTSPGIEPFSSNYYKVGLAKGNFIRRNKFLKETLKKYDKDNDGIWLSIMENAGSVQHLTFLSEHERNIFKTFKEISQKEIIIQASIRQKFIDQSQSLNLNIPPDMPVKEVNKLMIEAWKLGIKTLYYQRSESPSRNFNGNLTSCLSCDG